MKASANRKTTATVRRLNHCIKVLRNAYVSKGWAVDEEAAARAVRAVRAVGTGGSGVAALEFCIEHGLNLDYVFRGIIDGMITHGAYESPRYRRIKSKPSLMNRLERERHARLEAGRQAGA